MLKTGNKWFCAVTTIWVLAFLSVAAVKAATFTVTNTNDSDAGSLRQALLDANANSGSDTIVFNIAPGGVRTITLSSSGLPRISDPVTIDATTQPGYTGTPIIELKGIGFGSDYGLTIDAGNTTIRGLIINNFGSGGIGIFTNGGNLIENNFIGTNITGSAAQPNFGIGIQIFNSSNNVIGGTSANSRNLISGNGSRGIGLNGANASNNIIQGNYIGVNASGTAKIPNNGEGICLCSSNPGFNVTDNLIGGTTLGAGNLIAGNSNDEIEIAGFASVGNTVQGNLLGTDASGTQALTSVGHGVELSSATRNNIIGGSSVSARNIISGNLSGSSPGGNGIEINVSASGNIIKGNYIGTDITGTKALPNQLDGIVLNNGAHDNVIGGIGQGEGNIIAFNGSRGIVSSNSTSQPTNNNSIRGNSIYLNRGLGIDLFPGGVTANDPCDADTGINNLQNFPVLTSAARNGSTITVSGTLNSTANLAYAVDLFASPSLDATGYGEGKTYLGTINITTDNSCNGTFSVSFTSITGQFITATATDAAGNTSEFSQYIAASQSPFDFDGDGKTDVGIFRPGDGSWWYSRSSDNAFRVFSFGLGSDVITPGDFTGDGKTDIAVFRPASGEWFIQRSEDNSFFSFPFGANGDVPTPADFDGDGKTDAAVFRPSSGTWFILNSNGSGTSIVNFGSSEDKAVPADFDGDGKADIAIFRPSDGSWWYLRSTDSQFRVFRFGLGTDKPVQGDYTGDGKADLAVFRPETGEWFFQRSEDNSYYSVPFGAVGDIPAPGDYDGDGKFDTAVFRPATANWFIQRSTAGILITSFGTSGDRPIPNAFVP